MLTKDEMTEAIGTARTLVLEAILKHEREAHGGRACMANRASAIAHLAHCLAVRGEAWDYAKQLLGEYDANCVSLNCDHGNIPP